MPFREIIKKLPLLERLFSIFGPKYVALTTHKLEGRMISKGHRFDPSLGQKKFLVKSACMWFKKNIGFKCIIFHCRHFLIKPKFEDHHRFSQNFEIKTPSYFFKKMIVFGTKLAWCKNICPKHHILQNKIIHMHGPHSQSTVLSSQHTQLHGYNGFRRAWVRSPAGDVPKKTFQ